MSAGDRDVHKLVSSNETTYTHAREELFITKVYHTRHL